MQRTVVSALLLLSIAAGLIAAESQEYFESRAQIRAWIEARKGFGAPEFELLEVDRALYYFARFIPTSGIDHCHVYTFGKSEGPWRLMRHATFPGGCRITVRVEPASGDILYEASTGAELDRLRIR